MYKNRDTAPCSEARPGRGLAILFFCWSCLTGLPAYAAQTSLADHAARLLAAQELDEDSPATGPDAAPAPASGIDTLPVTPVPANPNPPLRETLSTPGETGFVALARLTFIHNKWELTEASRRSLDAAAAHLARNPGASRLLIRGHTDEVGSMRFNDGLSDKRASAVRDYLVDKGVADELIRWEGHGEHAPVDENWTRLGRARNRQVEIFAIYPPPLSASAR